jgi:hypothetical protein
MGSGFASHLSIGFPTQNLYTDLGANCVAAIPSAADSRMRPRTDPGTVCVIPIEIRKAKLMDPAIIPNIPSPIESPQKHSWNIKGSSENGLTLRHRR